VATQAIERIAWLYRVEQEAREMTSADRLRLRQERAQPLWNELYVWMRLERTRVADGGGIAAALVSFESALTPLRYWELCGCQLPQEPVFLQPGDRAHLVQTLPGQADDERVEPRLAQCHRRDVSISRGHTKWPALSLLAAHHTPKPSCTSILMRVARALANK
jgi:hypothetical protein